MIENVDLSAKLGKSEYKEALRPLKAELTALQHRINEQRLPVVIVLEGWSAAGKGTLIGKIVAPLDPRYFNVHTMAGAGRRRRRPFLWPYWTKLPAAGEIAIFDKSWMRASLKDTSAALSLQEMNGYYNDVNAFERQLQDSGTLVIKLFLHISKKEQYCRLKKLAKNPNTSWRVDEQDIEQNNCYDENSAEFAQMIKRTNSDRSPWHIVEAEDKRFATIKMYGIITRCIKEALEQRQETKVPEPEGRTVSVLQGIKPYCEISDEDYRLRLEELQQTVADLENKLYDKQRSVVIVYEGWDAAGKGGNIKRLTEKMDPRGYEVVPIAAPTTDELAHHYMWRFYKKLPKDGHVAIFDRSWYGRVMVERIEGFCATEEWQRAYREINEMERHLANHGVIILKFWIHIDQDEQLKRFEARQNDAAKRYKITDEDWRNREKWDEYEKAVDEMLLRTNTDYAPWEIIEGNNKKFARIRVLEKVASELTKQLSEGEGHGAG